MHKPFKPVDITIHKKTHKTTKRYRSQDGRFIHKPVSKETQQKETIAAFLQRLHKGDMDMDSSKGLKDKGIEEG